MKRKKVVQLKALHMHISDSESTKNLFREAFCRLAIISPACVALQNRHLIYILFIIKTASKIGIFEQFIVERQSITAAVFT